MNPRVCTAFLNEYLAYRKITWHSVRGYVQSLCRDDEAIKMTECLNWNKKFYNAEGDQLADEFKAWHSYLLVADSNNASDRYEKINQITEQHQVKNAYFYLVNSNNQIYCRYVQNGEMHYKEEEFELTEEMLQQLGGLPKPEEIRQLSMDQVDFIVANTSHVPVKQIEAGVNLFITLGEAGKTQSVLSSTEHGIRTYWLQKFKESERKNIFAAFVKNEANQCNTLALKITKLDVDLLKMKAGNKSKRDIEDAEKLLAETRNTYHQLLLKLCYLGDEISIVKAATFKLFSNLTYPNIQHVISEHILPLDVIKDLNTHMPYFYQKNHYLIHFHFYYQYQSKYKDFKEFEEKAITTSINELKAEAKSSISLSKIASTLYSSVVGIPPAPASTVTTTPRND